MVHRIAIVTTMLVLAGNAVGSELEDTCRELIDPPGACPVRQHDGGAYAPLGPLLDQLNGDAPDACRDLTGGAAAGERFAFRAGGPANGTLLPADDPLDHYWIDVAPGTGQLVLRAEARAALSVFPGMFLWEMPGFGAVLTPAPAAHLVIQVLDMACRPMAMSTTANPLETRLVWNDPEPGRYVVAVGYHDQAAENGAARSPGPVPDQGATSVGVRPTGEHPCGPMCFADEEMEHASACNAQSQPAGCVGSQRVGAMPGRLLHWNEEEVAPNCRTGDEDIDETVAAIARALVEIYVERGTIEFAAPNADDDKANPRGCAEAATDGESEPILSGTQQVLASGSLLGNSVSGEDSCDNGCRAEYGSPALFNYRLHAEV